MKTLFSSFFSRSSSTSGQTQEKKTAKSTSSRRRGPDKSAQAAAGGVHRRGTAESASPAPSAPVPETVPRTPDASSQPQKQPPTPPHARQQQQQPLAPSADATSSPSQSHPQTLSQWPPAESGLRDDDPGLFARLVRRGSTSSRGQNATPRSSPLTAIPDEGRREASAEDGHAAPSSSSCSQIAPPPHHHAPREQKNDAALPEELSGEGAKRTHQHQHQHRRRPSRLLQKSAASNERTNTADATANSTTTMSALRPRSSFRDRFWTAHAANDFGDKDATPTSPRLPLSPTSPITVISETPPLSPTTPTQSGAPSKYKAYVPRHAAADFSRTTIGSHHRQTASWDGGRASVRSRTPSNSTTLYPPEAANSLDQGNYYTLDPHSVAEEEGNPFADDNATDGPGDELTSEIASSSSYYSRRHQHRSSAPPVIDRSSTASSFARSSEDWPPSDYERFLAHAHADERAHRVQVARRSWREGSRRDSAYYSTWRGSARTSEDGSQGNSSSGAAQMPREAAASSLDAKRQSRVAQKIVEYIKPPREDGAKVSSVHED